MLVVDADELLSDALRLELPRLLRAGRPRWFKLFPRARRGPRRKLRRGHILHLDFALNDRARREAKVASYERLMPGHSANRSYLFEDLPREIRPCSEALPANSR